MSNKIITNEEIDKFALESILHIQGICKWNGDRDELLYTTAYNDGVLHLASMMKDYLNKCQNVEEASDD